MIGRLNHVAIVVPDLAAAAEIYRKTLGAKVSDMVDQPEHGVTTVFIELPNTKIELLGVLGEDSPIAGFLKRNPAGGIHHLCYEVPDIGQARDRLVAAGVHIVGTSDHTVTHSVYILDPDGNELELYIDVPGVDWRSNPEAVMAPTRPLAL